MDDHKERNIILNQFNLTEEEFNRAKHNMEYDVAPSMVSIPETHTGGEDYSKKRLR